MAEEPPALPTLPISQVQDPSAVPTPQSAKFGNTIAIPTLPICQDYEQPAVPTLLVDQV